VYDDYLPIWEDGLTTIVDGTLWQETPINLVRRDLDTGEALETLDKPPNAGRVPWFGFGSVWFATRSLDGVQPIELKRIDPLSGRELATIVIGEPDRGIAFTRDAIFALTREAEILEIDPDANALVDRDAVGLDTVPDAIVAIGGNVWICECEEGRITQWDPARDQKIRTVEFAQRGFILDDRRELTQGNVSVDATLVWLMNGDAGTITPVDAETAEAGQPIGIPQGSFWHDFGDGSIWISAGQEVYRLDLETGVGETIGLPDGVFAGGIAVDELTGSVWLANFVPFRTDQ
jgi:hypothetical protein